jgi:DNA polymerase (family X)
MMQRVIQLLNEIAELLDLSNSNRFKAHAIRKAIRTLEKGDWDLAHLVKTQNLQSLPGIGPGLEKIITEIVETGKSSYHQRLQRIIPLSLGPLLKISGLRRGEILRLYQQHLIQSLEDFQHCSKEQLLAMGISERRQRRIHKNIIEYLRFGPQILWWRAKEMEAFLEEQIFKCRFVKRCVCSGALRRCCNTLAQIDLVIETTHVLETIDWIANQPWTRLILKKTASVLIFKGPSDILIEITAARQHFEMHLFKTTGSPSHIRAFYKWLQSKGIKNKSLFLKSCATEKELYKKAALAFIPPELRENRGEIAQASQKKLPRLIKEKDIQGVLHCHTIDSDGTNTFEELAFAAEKIYGWKYIGISDHSKSCTIAGGMREEKLLKQIDAIQEFNKRKACRCHVFSGIECDILQDGTLDFSEEILKRLDFVIVSAHSHFSLSKAAMTKRFIKAIEHPYTTIIGHVSGRLLLHRPSYNIDLDTIIDACIANKKIMEINGQPSRLDMDWKFWRKAFDRGLQCAINPDAHSVYELRYYLAGINVARKGWVSPKEVINTKINPFHFYTQRDSKFG